jgi:hypothetical protein
VKVNFVTLLARQVEGEYFNLRILGVFADKQKMQEFVNGLDIPRGQVIEGIPCLLEIGIYEDVEVTE